jgi:hypothetical protein
MNKNNQEILLQRVSDHYEVKDHDIKTNDEDMVGVYKDFDSAYRLACEYQDKKEPRYGLRIVVS